MELKKLGRFEIEDEVGAGGMGIVYKGLDPKINRPVALKVIRSVLGSGKSADQKQALDRFYIEAQSAGRLSHQNIVTIYDVGEESAPGGDIVYIAMEFINGKGLDYHIETDTFSTLKDKIKIIKQVAEGLDYAHKRDIVHRDVKPANIILTEELLPKLMDFGLARFSDSSLTMSGTILGTPNYMAPEQVQGKKVDARSDFFALTVIFYEMLTNEKPFAGDTITTVIYRVVNEDPILPSKLNPELPASVDQMIKKGLSKSRDTRFQSGAEYIEALDSILADPSKPLEVAKSAPVDPGSTMVMGNEEVFAARKADFKKALLDKKILISGGAAAVVVLVLLIVLFTGGDSGKKPARPEMSATTQVKPDIVKAKAKNDKAPALPAKQKAEQDKKAKIKDTTVKPKQAKKESATAKIGLVTVRSDPETAEVFLDGEFLGFTPVYNYRFNQGWRQLKVVKQGYQPYLKKVKLGAKSSFSATLVKGRAGSKQKTPQQIASIGSVGSLKVLSPPKSLIYIDGKEYRDQKVTLSDLSLGSHQVYIQVKGRKPYNKRITIKKDQTKTIDVR